MSKNRKEREDYLLLMEKALKQFRRFSQLEMNKRNIDISAEQWSVLMKCYEQPGVSQRNIASTTFKDPASVTRMIDILEKRKLLTRKADPNDRRSHDVFLTDKGKVFVEDVLPLVDEMKSFGLRGVSPSDQKAFFSVLDKIYNNLEM